MPIEAEDIQDAMAALANGHPHFGDGGNPGPGLERGFQEALCHQLNEQTRALGWSWHREVRYPTQALRNAGEVAVDIVGQHGEHGLVGIELKYVVNVPGTNRPSNTSGFPYDVMKDCLKLEIIKGGGGLESAKAVGIQGADTNGDQLQRLHGGRLVRSYVIGLTNHAAYYSPENHYNDWAQEFHNRISPIKNKNEVTVKPGVTHTHGAPAVVYLRKRNHLAIGKTWTGGWFQYGENDSGFKYLLLSNAGADAPEYTHKKSDTLPFYRDGARDDCERIAQGLREGVLELIRGGKLLPTEDAPLTEIYYYFNEIIQGILADNGVVATLHATDARALKVRQSTSATFEIALTKKGYKFGFYMTGAKFNRFIEDYPDGLPGWDVAQQRVTWRSTNQGHNWRDLVEQGQGLEGVCTQIVTAFRMFMDEFPSREEFANSQWYFD